MRAGVAVRDVTPPSGARMAGFVAREAGATGVHDPLLVHALVVGDTALLTVDVVGLHEDDCAEITRRCALPADRVVVHATHTHGSPASMRRRLGGGVDPAWLETLIATCGPVDPALPVLHLLRRDGSLLAAVVPYACHPVVLGADNTLFAADHPGVVRRILTERLGAPVLFVTGCAGDVNTGHAAGASVSTAAAVDRTFAECERVGVLVAQELLDETA